MYGAIANISTLQKVFPHALVLEDNIILTEHFEDILSHEGFDIDFAKTAKCARKALKKKRFDLMVTDLRLLDNDGVKAFSKIRVQEPDAEIILVSDAEPIETSEKVLIRGIHQFQQNHAICVQGTTALRDHAWKDLENFKRIEIHENTALGEKASQGLIVKQVLNDAIDDPAFWVQLLENGSAALAKYNLSSEAKAAITSGDIQWVYDNVGDLPERQMAFLYKRLEREAW
ncbi:hypothetical protein DSCW_36080 [Desulfosarcina widdelii]|uniref:Response regulatory domain-containing protein n=1 Tax=Desulfosarcina widdelii TaxID=947919 RepID=A0A5K7Z912_9BACT|nr:response regulator [Desulfosarcina widdelii]BBO76191.1 hypothetical protein DSCW_36080 [Desulfosarcina widdelii]